MRIPTRFGAALTGAAIATMAISGLAAASHPGGYGLFGDAEYVTGNASPRAVQIRSDTTPGWGGIDFDIPAGTTFADLTELLTDFKPEADDFCLGGSPRFQINFDQDATGDGFADNIFAYFGPNPALPPCVPGVWQTTTDLLDADKFVDTSQLGGTFYDPYVNALANYGGLTVTGVQVVVDASWAHLDSEQTFVIDNTSIGIDSVPHLYTYERAQPTNSDECKDGGWMELVDDEGNSFKNQGDCVSYLNTGKN